MVARPGFARAQQSARAKGGASAEAAVEACNAACEVARVACLWRNPVPTREIRPGQIIRIAKAVSDYGGIMLDGTGRCVAVEVKRLATKSLRFPLSRIEPHQRAHLEAVYRAGGVAVVLVVHGGRMYPVGWATVRDAMASGLHSLTDEAVSGCYSPPVYLSRWAIYGIPPVNASLADGRLPVASSPVADLSATGRASAPSGAGRGRL